MNTEIIIIGGLRETKPDSRDLKLGSITTLPKLEELPKEFILEPLEIKNQQNTDFCSAFSTCAMSELQEGVLLEPSWSFAIGKMISGDMEEFGQDIRVALKTHVKYGAIEKSITPYSLENQSSEFLRDIRNWPNLEEKAVSHKKKTYFKVTGNLDNFDNVRATIWKFREEKRAIGFGILWGWSSYKIKIDDPKTSGVGHMITAIGWKEIEGELYLIIQNSYGTQAGENGKHYFSRAVTNDAVEKYGAYMFLDMDKETVKWYIENNIKLEDSWFARLLKRIKAFFK